MSLSIQYKALHLALHNVEFKYSIGKHLPALQWLLIIDLTFQIKSIYCWMQNFHISVFSRCFISMGSINLGQILNEWPEISDSSLKMVLLAKS